MLEAHDTFHTQVAAGLTDAALPKGNCAVRIMLFVGGPTTEGGGQVVDKELSEPIRSHKARTPSCPCCANAIDLGPFCDCRP